MSLVVHFISAANQWIVNGTECFTSDWINVALPVSIASEVLKVYMDKSLQIFCFDSSLPLSEHNDSTLVIACKQN